MAPGTISANSVSIMPSRLTTRKVGTKPPPNIIVNTKKNVKNTRPGSFFSESTKPPRMVSSMLSAVPPSVTISVLR